MIKINESIKPNGGDGKNYFMFYAGPGYPSRKEVEKFAKENGCTTIWFGSDESYGLKGMYNGDTFVVCKDINKLPSNYKEDAKKHGELIESLDEKFVDGDRIDFMKVNVGDQVEFSIEGMTDPPKIRDYFRVGPLTGKCVRTTKDTVVMKVEGHSFKMVNESNSVVKSELLKYINRKDVKGLTQYLASMPDDTECPDPNDPSTVYHKASNGVKSGWGERINGKRINVYLWTDEQVARSLIGV